MHIHEANARVEIGMCGNFNSQYCSTTYLTLKKDSIVKITFT